MAENELYLKIGVQLDELKKGLNNVDKELKGFKTKTKQNLKEGLNVDEPIANLKGGVLGAGEEFLRLGKAAQKGGQAMKSALIGTGVGILVIALGEIVENWDAIAEAIGFVNNDIQYQNDLLDNNLSAAKVRLKVLAEEFKLLQGTGQSTEENVKQQKKLNAEIIETAAARKVGLLSQIEAARLLANEKTKQASYTIQTGFGQGTSTTVTKTIAKTSKEILEQATALSELEKEYSALELVQINAQTTIKKLGGEWIEATKKVKTYQAQLREVATTVNAGLKPQDTTQSIGEGFVAPDIGTELKKIPLKTTLTDWEKDLAGFNENASEIITNGVGNAFAGLGEAIGSSLANGGNIFKSLGDTLLKAIGGIAVQLGKAAIAIGVGMLKIKLAFSNPFTAIAAGIALVALGSALGGITNKATSGIGGGAGGGAGTGGGYESSTSGNNINTAGANVSFEIQGTKLVGVLENQLNTSSNFGGQSKRYG